VTSFQFEAIGGEWIDPPILIPAALPLELSGESIRNRLITSSDTPGEELALRPDLTLPAAMYFLASGDEAPVSYRYRGRAFRQPRSAVERAEFDQTGFENFGHEDKLARDVLTLSTMCEEVAGAGVRDGQLYLGDVSIFHAVVDALELSRHWNARVTRAFRRREGLQALLKTGGAEDNRHSALAETLANLPADAARDLLDEVMSLSGTEIVGGRTKDEILERLQARAEAASAGDMPDKAREVLNVFTGISGPPSVFLARLKELVSQFSLGLEGMTEKTEKLFEALSQKNMPFWSQAHVSVQFGRRFDYYDGMVFELCHTSLSSERPLATGGRYDGLLTWLSEGEHNLPAVGGVIRPDRVEAAVKAEAGEGA
tara:strand:+ start:189787 stop:190899 length:1113 start_codon:yes stop_codon:yes gene_type:complete